MPSRTRFNIIVSGGSGDDLVIARKGHSACMTPGHPGPMDYRFCHHLLSLPMVQTSTYPNDEAPMRFRPSINGEHMSELDLNRSNEREATHFRTGGISFNGYRARTTFGPDLLRSGLFLTHPVDRSRRALRLVVDRAGGRPGRKRWKSSVLSLVMTWVRALRGLHEQALCHSRFEFRVDWYNVKKVLVDHEGRQTT
jgi:hypothetical protein